jgi:CheY-like chemotaxis protein
MTRAMPIDPARAALPEVDQRDAPAFMLLGHDLRAALSEVMGGLRLVDGTELPAAPRAQIARSRAACEALALLLEQTMALMLGEAGPYDDPPAAICTARFLESLRLRWNGRALAVGTRFTLLASPDLPPFLALDPAMIERILSNLLGNALKYASGGNVTCDVRMTGESSLQISVQDDGPGFPLALLVRHPQRAPYAEPGPLPGTGLGLRIVHEMVERAGGSIITGNLIPHGAEVIVRLPLGAVTTLPALADGSETLPDLSHLRILVADDSETSRLLAAQLLGRMGAEVVTVADGVAAIGRIERESFDALLIDIEMPRFSGLDVIHFVRAMPGPMAKLPILAVPAYWLRANREAIEAAGANAVLSKPGLSAALLGTAILEETKLPRTSDRAAPVPQDRDIQTGQFSHFLDLVGPDAAAELLAQLLKDLQTAERGLLGAARGPNWQGIQAQTHVLIALAGTTGATRLQHLSEALNTLAHHPAPDRGTYLTLLPQTLEALDALIHFVGTQTPPRGETS